MSRNKAEVSEGKHFSSLKILNLRTQIMLKLVLEDLCEIFFSHVLNESQNNKNLA